MWLWIGLAVVAIVIAIALMKRKGRKSGPCSYYIGGSCTAGSAMGNPSGDPTQIMGWDMDLCEEKGGAGCEYCQVASVFGNKWK